MQLARKEPFLEDFEEGAGDLLQEIVGEGSNKGIAVGSVSVNEADERTAVCF